MRFPSRTPGSQGVSNVGTERSRWGSDIPVFRLPQRFSPDRFDLHSYLRASRRASMADRRPSGRFVRFGGPRIAASMGWPSAVDAAIVSSIRARQRAYKAGSAKNACPRVRPPSATASPLKGMFHTSLRQRSAAKFSTSLASMPLSQNASTIRRVRASDGAGELTNREHPVPKVIHARWRSVG